MRGGAYILIVIIVVMAVCLVIASGYEYLQAKIAPMLVGGAIIILSVVELIKDLRVSRNQADSKREPAKVDIEGQPYAYPKEAGWMVGFFFLIYLVGFTVGIAAFTAVYAKARKTRWSTSVVLGVLMAGLSYFLFSYLVETDLYPGLILRQLGLGG